MTSQETYNPSLTCGPKAARLQDKGKGRQMTTDPRRGYRPQLKARGKGTMRTGCKKNSFLPEEPPPLDDYAKEASEDENIERISSEFTVI